MKKEHGLLKAFQSVFRDFRFTESDHFPEAFAIQRYVKKMEEPDHSRSSERKTKCFEDWLAFDNNLKKVMVKYQGGERFRPNWYRARDWMHRILRNFRSPELLFTPGSAAAPTRGRNSLESKLILQPWECSLSAFDDWAKAAYNHLAIKRAVRKRITRLHGGNARGERSYYKWLWMRYKDSGPSRSFLCFRYSLALVTSVRNASRFSTVPKNVEKDRPINLEPSVAILLQRQVGEGVRRVLKDHCDVDLDHLADKHRLLISKRGLATLDLQNASDSISLTLCEFLFPKWFVDLLSKTRSPFVEGLDGHYYMTEKLSSMGCGFTFEVMTLVLLSLGRQIDPNFSVFGDDIIVSKNVAEEVITDLESVGFVINKEKSFVDGPFRESCGANWHDDHGYIRSFDFRWPTSIHDCIVLHNKAFALGQCGYHQFGRLAQVLARIVPRTWQGPEFSFSHEEDDIPDAVSFVKDEESLRLSTFFWASKPKGGVRLLEPVKAVLKDYQLTDEIAFFGFAWRPARASPTLDRLIMRRHTGKYMMYLHAGKRTDDVYTGRGAWVPVVYVAVGRRVFRAKTLASFRVKPKTD
jgi:hypothetical protein